MIQQIEIHNYKSIREAAIPLRRINILIGENGAGKSNFISFLEMVKALHDQRLGRYMLSNGGMSAQLYRGLKHSNFIKGILDFDKTDAFFFTLRPTTGEKAYVEETGSYATPHPMTEEDNPYREKAIWNRDVEEAGMENVIDEGAKRIKELLGNFIVYHFHDTGKLSPMRRPCPVDDNVTLRPDASNLPAILYRLQQTAPASYRLIEATVRSVAPYFKRFRLEPMATDPGRIKLVWEEMDSDMYLDATSLSDGTLRLIALSTLLLQPTLPETIIIDEPELGLHPAAMMKLAAMVKRASERSQVIIATQSITLISNFTLEDLIVVGRDGEQSTFHRPDPEEFTSWLDDYSVGELWEKNIIGGRP